MTMAVSGRGLQLPGRLLRPLPLLLLRDRSWPPPRTAFASSESHLGSAKARAKDAIYLPQSSGQAGLQMMPGCRMPFQKKAPAPALPPSPGSSPLAAGTPSLLACPICGKKPQSHRYHTMKLIRVQERIDHLLYCTISEILCGLKLCNAAVGAVHSFACARQRARRRACAAPVKRAEAPATSKQRQQHSGPELGCPATIHHPYISGSGRAGL
jgi:hypothetical protein